MKRTAFILWIAVTCITLLPLQSPAGDKKTPAEEKEPAEYYVVQTFGFFDNNSVALLDQANMLKSQEMARQRNRTISAAYKAAAKQWSLQELGTLEERKERKERRKKGEKKKRARPFVMDKPSLISLKVDGPFEDQADAEARRAECDAVMVERAAKATKQEETRLRMMSDNVSKSYNENNALRDEQIEMFLAEVDSMAKKNVSGLLGATGIKRVGGRIAPLVRNQHSMKGTAANSQTATKVDPRAVRK